MIESPNGLESAPSRGAGTRQRIIDAAERLYAQHGVQNTSLRLITTEAKVNLAAINYHFQSKEQLIGAVLRRIVEPMNQYRLELLDTAEGAARGKPAKLEAVLRAFILPVFAPRDGRSEVVAPTLYGRLQSEPGELIAKMFLPLFAPVLERFRPAFRRALPNLTDAAIGWGIHFTIGAMSHTLSSRQVLAGLTLGDSANKSNAGMVDVLIPFCAAGFRGAARVTPGQGGN